MIDVMAIVEIITGQRNLRRESADSRDDSTNASLPRHNLQRQAVDGANASLPAMSDSSTSMISTAGLRAEGERQVMAPDFSAWPGKHIVEEAGVLDTKNLRLPSITEQSIKHDLLDANVTRKRRRGAQQGPTPSASDRRIQPSQAREFITPRPRGTLYLQSDSRGEPSTGRTGVADNPQPSASPVVPSGLQLDGQDLGRSGALKPEPQGQELDVITHEAHVWDSQTKKQIYLGGFATDQEARMSHDRMALKLREAGRVHEVKLNFAESVHDEYMNEFKDWSLGDFKWNIRKQSKSFNQGRRGKNYKGVIAREGKDGVVRYLAQISVTMCIKDSAGSFPWCSRGCNCYRGRGWSSHYSFPIRNGAEATFSNEEEAARQYDLAAMFFRGSDEMTNFRPSNYGAEEIQEAGQKLLRARELSIPRRRR